MHAKSKPQKQRLTCLSCSHLHSTRLEFSHSDDSSKLTKACEDWVWHHKQVFLLKLMFPLSLLPVSRVANGRPASVRLSVVLPAPDPAVSCAHERSLRATRHCVSKDVPRSLKQDVQNIWSIVMFRDTLKRTPKYASKHDSGKKKRRGWRQEDQDHREDGLGIGACLRYQSPAKKTRDFHISALDRPGAKKKSTPVRHSLLAVCPRSTGPPRPSLS